MSSFGLVCVLAVILVNSASGQYNEEACAKYDHPDHGCTGRCYDENACPGGTDHVVAGLCPTQASRIKCCFTVDEKRDLDCLDPSKEGNNCISTEQCPSTPLTGACPTKPDNVKCCLDKPTDTCVDRDYVDNYDCLHCICMVESNCQQLDPICRWDVNSDSCGPYQIKKVYYIDAKTYANGVLGGDWRSCTASFHCSEQIINGYMRRYATSSRLGRTPTCEDFARIHNGGPNGHLNDGTLQYWNKVKTCLDNKF